MTGKIPSMVDPITHETIINAFKVAYTELNGNDPECMHVGGDKYMINGETCNCLWLIFEIDRLRQELLAKASTERWSLRKLRQLIAKLAFQLCCRSVIKYQPLYAFHTYCRRRMVWFR
jgi:hypothetical protein